VAADGDELIGFVCAWVTRGRSTPGIAGEMDWLWVDPAHRGGGIERRLAEAAVDWLRQRGAGAIFKIEDAQHPAREPWEGLGFKPDVLRFSLR
jgi:GNAT superfamily N-acetyltransferase